MASEVLITISKDERERAWLESQLKYELDTQSKMTQAKKEGISIGRQDERKDVLDLLKSGKSLEQIIRDYENKHS